MEKSKITKSLAIFASVLLIIIIGVASFAYFGTFNVNLVNNVAVNINSSSPGNATFVSNATQLNLQVPAANMSFTAANNTVAAKEDTAFLDVTLTGSANLLTTCTYDIVYEYDAGSNVYGQGTTTKTSGATKEITIEVNGMNGNNHFATERNFDHASIQSYYDSTNKYYKLVEGATIKSLGSTQSVRWKITGRYYNLNVSQAQLGGKNFTGKIYAISKGCSSEDGTTVKKGYETILANNGGKTSIEAKTAPSFANIETGNAGMYSYTEGTEGTGKTYYYRGAVDNNWVKYGKFKEEQIVYRGFYDENTNSNDFLDMNQRKVNYLDYSTLEECQTGVASDMYGSSYKYGSSYNYKCKEVTYAHKGDDMYWRIIRVDKDNKIKMIYAGSKAPSENTKVTITGANTNMGFTAYNNAYNNAEYVGFQYTEGSQRGTTTNSTIKTYLDNWYTKYFNENISTSRFVKTTFCNDRNTSSTWASNGSSVVYAPLTSLSADTPTPTFECNNADVVTNNLGLITADEIVLAGGKAGTNNSAFYLNNNMVYWAGSPYGFNGSDSIVFELNPIYGLNPDGVDIRTGGARGVVSLSSESKLLGSGTYNDVYIVS